MQIDRRALLAGLPAAALATAASRVEARTVDPAAIHRRALVFDAHVDILLPGTPARYQAPGGGSRSDLARLRQGGVDGLAYAVAVSTGPRSAEGYAAGASEADAKLAAIHEIARTSAGEIRIASTADDIRRAAREGRIAVLPSFLNAYSLGEDFANFDRFHAGGVRLAGLAHAGNTVFADSSRPGTAGQEHHGLSEKGKAAVRRLNDLGVLIDVSQLTPAGVQQTRSISRAPIVATHSGARALVNATRNLSDPELDLIASSGGVVHVTPFNAYIARRPADYAARLEALRRENGLAAAGGSNDGIDVLSEDQRRAYQTAVAALTPRATVPDFVDHIDHIRRRVGDDHVGIGSDFNHGAGIVGFDSEAEAPAVTRELLARGYNEAQIGRIWSGNFLRALDAAQGLAR